MKYVLVTGACGGMGKSIVSKLASAGYGVFALDKVACEQEENVFPIQADLTDENSVKSALEEVKERTDSLYAILHFAGVYVLNSLVEIEDKNFCKAFDINLFGVYRVNKIFLPMLKNGSRIVITTSELAPLDPLPFTGVYAITKSALDKYAYSLRMELQLLGIKVVVMRPGAVDTGMIGVSTKQLDDFCQNTKIYTCNATRFKNIVERVEARKILPKKIADKTLKILAKSNPKFVYKINRNPLLLMLNVLPKRMQTAIIKGVLKNKKEN